ncbi:MAG: hypothetical protein IJ515_04690 [Clostridia bacterium]|nr:hypothetical protein [Clostridia bacterium]
MATFYNQATLSYNGGVTASNVTEGELVEVLSASKIAISAEYTAGGTVAYAISIVNSGTTPITAATITDNLGGYPLGGGTVYPLEYVDGSIRLLINGVEVAAPTVSAGPPMTVSGINIPAGASAVILYEAAVTEFAPLAPDSTITNTAVIEGSCPGAVTVSATVAVRDDVSLTIAKAICPDTVVCGDQLTYTFIIQNTGNTAAVATDNVILTDVFDPALSDITVTLNGATLPAGAYTYNEATGEFATAVGTITVPAATYTTDPETGAVITAPGVTVLTVTGTV